MFDLTRPCVSCPFRKGQGERFLLRAGALDQFFGAPAFQCHKTLDLNFEEGDLRRKGDHPQQCAGIMSLLHRAGRPNQIMQVGERLGWFDGAKLDHSDVYDTLDAVRTRTQEVQAMSNIILITMRLADMHMVHPDQITGKCADCGHDVGIYPSGQAAMREDPEIRVVCQVCRPQGGDLFILAPGAELEPFQSVRKKP